MPGGLTFVTGQLDENFYVYLNNLNKFKRVTTLTISVQEVVNLEVLFFLFYLNIFID